MSQDTDRRVRAIFADSAHPATIATDTVALLREINTYPENAIDVASAIALAVQIDPRQRLLAVAMLSLISEAVALIDRGPNGPHWEAHKILQGAAIAMR